MTLPLILLCNKPVRRSFNRSDSFQPVMKSHLWKSAVFQSWVRHNFSNVQLPENLNQWTRPQIQFGPIQRGRKSTLRRVSFPQTLKVGRHMRIIKLSCLVTTWKQCDNVSVGVRCLLQTSTSLAVWPTALLFWLGLIASAIACSGWAIEQLANEVQKNRAESDSRQTM